MKTNTMKVEIDLKYNNIPSETKKEFLKFIRDSINCTGVEGMFVKVKRIRMK